MLRNTRAALEALGPSFYSLLGATFLSEAAEYSTAAALLLHIYKLSQGSVFLLGALMVATMAPFMIFAPIGGRLAARRDLPRLLIACSLLRIPLVLLLSALNWIPGLVLLQAVISALTAIAMPIRQTLQPQLVASGRFEVANTLSGSVNSFCHFVGPPLGALLYTKLQSLPPIIAIEATAYVLAVFLLTRIPNATAPLARSGEAAGEEFEAEGKIFDGLRFVMRRADLLRLLLCILFFGLFDGILETLLRPFVGRSLGGGDALYAALLSALGIAGLIGPLLGFFAMRWLGSGRALFVLYTIDAAFAVSWVLIRDPRLSVAVIGLWGVVLFAIEPCYSSYIHFHVRADRMGRTFAFYEQSINCAKLLGAAGVALVGSRIPPAPILLSGASLYLVMTLFALLRARPEGDVKGG